MLGSNLSLLCARQILLISILSLQPHEPVYFRGKVLLCSPCPLWGRGIGVQVQGTRSCYQSIGLAPDSGIFLLVEGE